MAFLNNSIENSLFKDTTLIEFSSYLLKNNFYILIGRIVF